MSADEQGLEKETEKYLEDFEKALQYEFHDRNLLVEALTHPSFVHEGEEKSATHYERLEFLGDAVLELATSTMLYNMRPNDGEGDLTRARADLVNQRSLSAIASELKVDQALRLGAGERKSGGAQKPSILSSALEAIIGAVYLDSGWDKAGMLVERLLRPIAETQPVGLKDPRSVLQEWTQSHNGQPPEYRYVSDHGPPHRKVFKVELRIGGELVSSGEGMNKKEACRKAATNALKKLMSEGYNFN